MVFIRHDVFISYSHDDSAATDAFVEELRKRGYNVFYDKKSIMVGEPWKRRLERAVKSARVCILCWSANARKSEYVAFEYSRAQGLGKPVLPWLLDETPLPQMIEIQGLVERDPALVTAQFVSRLGWKLSVRRAALALALLLAVAAAAVVYWRMHPPPSPWEFNGRVTDSLTGLPISGVKVEADGDRYIAYTDNDGKYVLRLPQPKPKHLHLVFVKEGYKAEVPVAVLPDNQPWNVEMARLP